MNSTYTRALPIALGRALLTPVVPATAGALNDIGMQSCGLYPNGNSADCTTPGPAGQDRQFGRDAAAKAGLLTRIGGGDAISISGAWLSGAGCTERSIPH